MHPEYLYTTCADQYRQTFEPDWTLKPYRICTITLNLPHPRSVIIPNVDCIFSLMYQRDLHLEAWLSQSAVHCGSVALPPALKRSVCSTKHECIRLVKPDRGPQPAIRTST